MFKILKSFSHDVKCSCFFFLINKNNKPFWPNQLETLKILGYSANSVFTFLFLFIHRPKRKINFPAFFFLRSQRDLNLQRQITFFPNLKIISFSENWTHFRTLPVLQAYICPSKCQEQSTVPSSGSSLVSQMNLLQPIVTFC